MKSKGFVIFLCAIFFTAIYLLTAGGHFYNQDGYQKYLLLESFQKGWGPFNPDFYSIAKEGLHASHYPFGTTVWMAPLFILGKAAFYIFSDPSSGNEVYFTTAATSFLNAFFTAGLLTFFFLLLQAMNIRPWQAFLNTCLVGFASMLWPYSKFCFSEPQSAFFLLGSFYFLLINKREQRLSRVWLSALLFGLALITKYETLLFIPVFLGYLIFTIPEEKKSQIFQSIGIYLFNFLMCAVLIGAWNIWRFNSPFEFGQYAEHAPSDLGVIAGVTSGAILFFIFMISFVLSQKFKIWAKQNSGFIFGIGSGVFSVIYLFLNEPAREMAWLPLFSPGKSLFLFSPVLILSLIGFSDFFKKWKAEAFFILALFLVSVLFMRYSPDWQWGARYHLPLIPFLAIPFGVFWHLQYKKALRILGSFLIGISFLIQMIAVLCNYHQTFNWISQKISEEVGVSFTNAEIEARYALPDMRSKWRYMPIWQQAQVVGNLFTKNIPEPQKKLTFKATLTDPHAWHVDFWWYYLQQRNVSLALLVQIMGVLLGGALFAFLKLRSLLRE